MDNVTRFAREYLKQRFPGIAGRISNASCVEFIPPCSCWHEINLTTKFLTKTGEEVLYNYDYAKTGVYAWTKVDHRADYAVWYRDGEITIAAINWTAIDEEIELQKVRAEKFVEERMRDFGMIEFPGD